ncbi:putative 5`-nucleotidase protein [Diplocarpon rosae]|nr:putative 5`-nucleotidase protein [Diplocarpon rosae]
MWSWGEYLGYIDVTYDPSGRILAYHGAPIHLTDRIAQDPELQAKIDDWRGGFEDFYRQQIGVTEVYLGEALLGQFIADSMLDYRRSLTSAVDFSIITLGAVRAFIDKGPITRGMMVTSFPFANAVVEFEISGEEIWATLEGAFAMVNPYTHKPVTSGIQVSDNIQITFNHDAAEARKLISGVGMYADAAPASPGGDNLFVARPKVTALENEDEVLVRYIASQSPIRTTFASRIVSRNDNGTLSVYVGGAQGTTFA